MKTFENKKAQNFHSEPFSIFLILILWSVGESNP